jgi:hypothetical protein
MKFSVYLPPDAVANGGTRANGRGYPATIPWARNIPSLLSLSATRLRGHRRNERSGEELQIPHVLLSG